MAKRKYDIYQDVINGFSSKAEAKKLKEKREHSIVTAKLAPGLIKQGDEHKLAHLTPAQRKAGALPVFHDNCFDCKILMRVIDNATQFDV